MSCSNSFDEVTRRPQCGNGYVCIIVLYILLAIIVGSLI